MFTYIYKCFTRDERQINMYMYMNIVTSAVDSSVNWPKTRSYWSFLLLSLNKLVSSFFWTFPHLMTLSLLLSTGVLGFCAWAWTTLCIEETPCPLDYTTGTVQCMWSFTFTLAIPHTFSIQPMHFIYHPTCRDTVFICVCICHEHMVWRVSKFLN